MLPFRTILMAADFSERSRAAFRAACSLAQEAKTRVFVLHIVEPGHVPDRQFSFSELGLPASPDESGLSYFDRLEERLRRFYVPDRPLEVEYFVEVGGAAEEILRRAEDLGADLIVLGTHGRTGLGRLLAGSVAEAVLRGAHRPVLALSSPGLPWPAEPIRAILHPTDFSERDEAALRVARALARDHGARLILLHVAPVVIAHHGAMATLPDPCDLRDALEGVRKRIDGPDLKHPVEVRLRTGDAAAGIVEEAEQGGCGLIVLGTHGRTGLGRLLMGSVAEGVLRQSHCPVLAVKLPLSTAVATTVMPGGASR
jgi:nucleotide-binding universal stress UspA family protein